MSARGSWARGARALGADDAAPAATSPTLAETLAAKHLVFAVSCSLKPLGGGDDVHFYWSDRFFISRATDTPANHQFGQWIDEAGDEMRLSIDPTATADNSLSGKIVLLDPDGSIEASIRACDYTKRPIEISVGRSAGLKWASRQDDPYAWFHRLNTCVIDSISGDDGRLTISIRDRAYLLDVALQVNRYAGTGTYEGPASLFGEPKPLTGGMIYYDEPRLVDAVYLIYQVVDFDVTGTNDFFVYDNGVQLTRDGLSTNLYGDVIAAGHYRVDVARGMIRLGATPAGRILVYGTGMHRYVVRSPEVVARPYVTHPDVARAAIERRLPTFPINAASFDALADELLLPAFPVWSGYNRCIARVEPGETVRAYINRLMQGCGARGYMHPVTGELNVRRLKRPIAADVVIELDQWNILDLKRLDLPDALWPPPYQIEFLQNQILGWPTNSNIANGTSNALRSRLQKENVRRVETNPYVIGRYANAQAWEGFQTWSDSGTDPLAGDSATSIFIRYLIELHGGTYADGWFPRQLLHVSLGAQGLALEPDSTVLITWPKYGLDTGKLFVAMPVDRSFVSRSAPPRVELLCWGGFAP